MRFSYLEQVTKEKFLRAIVGDPPLIVEHQENVEVEAQLAEVKASLKAQKIEVADMVTELERSGRDLTRRMNPSQEDQGSANKASALRLPKYTVKDRPARIAT